MDDMNFSDNCKEEPPLVYCIDFADRMVEEEIDRDYLVSSWLDLLTDIELFFLLQITMDIYEEGESLYMKDILTLVGLMLSETFDDLSDIDNRKLQEYVETFSWVVVLEAMKRDGKVEYKPFNFDDEDVEYWYVGEEDMYKDKLCSSIKDFFDEHSNDKEIKDDDKKDKK